MRMLGMVAADEGVERGNAVHQVVVEQKIQGAVDRWRRSATAIFFAQDRKDVVGTQRLVTLPDQFQHATAQRGQAQTLSGAQRIGFGEGRMHAMGVIMGATSQGSIGHEQRRYLPETLLCYLFPPDMSVLRAPFS